MGARGPRGNGQGHRPHNILQLVPDLAESTPTAPDPPEGLLPDTQARWLQYWQSEVALALHHIDRGDLERLFRYYDEWQRSMDAVSALRFVEGSTGQLKNNPAADYAIKLEPLIQKLEDKLGIGPLARERLGITSNSRKLTAAELNRLTSKQPAPKPVPRRKRAAGDGARAKTIEGEWEAVE